MGFPGMITSVPCVTDKTTQKTAKRIANTMREKRECRSCCPSSTLRCLEVHWCLLRDIDPLGVPASSGDPRDKYSYFGLKLGRMAPNKHP